MTLMRMLPRNQSNMNILVWLVLKLLRSHKITGEQKSKVTNALLENIDSLPIRDCIKVGLQGDIIIHGRHLVLEQLNGIRSSAQQLRDSQVRKLIKEQLQFEAVKIGVHNGLTPDSILFSKAILWVLQEEDKLIDKLAE